MLRSLLVGILAVSMAPACKGATDAPSVQPGLAVGKVIDLEGKVTATRDGKERTLAAQDEISGDDVIATGDGRVMIWLTFNNATWDLPPHRTERVGDSPAWKLEKVAAIPAAVQEATISGGRHAEKSAADTRESAPRAPMAVPTAPADPAPPVQQQARTDGAAATAPGGPAGEPSGGPRGGDAPTSAPKAKAAVAVKGGGGPASRPLLGEAEDRRTEEVEKRSVPPPPSAVPTAPSAARDEAEERKTRPTTPAASPAKQLASQQAKLATCLQGATTLPIVLVVKAGHATLTAVKGTAKQNACLAEVAATFRFDASVNVKLDYVLPK